MKGRNRLIKNLTFLNIWSVTVTHIKLFNIACDPRELLSNLLEALDNNRLI